jgi:hypothetical protein
MRAGLQNWVAGTQRWRFAGSCGAGQCDWPNEGFPILRVFCNFFPKKVEQRKAEPFQKNKYAKSYFFADFFRKSQTSKGLSPFKPNPTKQKRNTSRTKPFINYLKKRKGIFKGGALKILLYFFVIHILPTILVFRLIGFLGLLRIIVALNG